MAAKKNSSLKQKTLKAKTIFFAINGLCHENGRPLLDLVFLGFSEILLLAMGFSFSPLDGCLNFIPGAPNQHETPDFSINKKTGLPHSRQPGCFS
ncbi:MAG: hypothetical protein JXO49_07220 [Deltaproteobacteria bacterium]|nr:hypothetical protein [Candidatus Anaeroferrophillus wilburensis]MBN2889119.1 hypothetical protein [Deltaproteobacteria bacterium]